MLKKENFKQKRNQLEGYNPALDELSPNVPDSLFVKCPHCSHLTLGAELDENQMVCPKCGYHMRLPQERGFTISAMAVPFRMGCRCLQQGSAFLSRLPGEGKEQPAQEPGDVCRGDRQRRGGEDILRAVCHGRTVYDGQHGFCRGRKNYARV